MWKLMEGEQAWKLETISKDIDVARVWYLEAWTREVALQIVGNGYTLIIEQRNYQWIVFGDEGRKGVEKFTSTEMKIKSCALTKLNFRWLPMLRWLVS